MKLTLVLVSAALALFIAGCTNSSAPNESSRYGDSLTLALEKISKASLIPGFAVAVVNDKNILFSKSFGFSNLKDSTPFTPKTIHWVASVSKTFVALSVMKLVDEHKLDLDEPINAILPYPVNNPYFPTTPITVRHLMTHTSSIIDDAFVPYYIGEADICLEEDGKQYDSLPAYLQPNLKYYRMGKKISLDENIRKYTQPGAKWYTDSTFLQHEPGTFFNYSNLGASIAARIVEIRSGMSFVDYTTKYIFQPLHMQNTGWNFSDLDANLISRIYVQNDEQNPTGVVEHPQYYMTNFPVSGLKSNSEDLGLYLIEMIKGANGSGKLLSKASYQTLFAPQPDPQGLNKRDTTIFNDQYSIAALWSVSASGLRMHFGGNTGVYAFVYFDPKRKKGALAYCNLREDSFGKILSAVSTYEPYIVGR